MSKSTPSRVIVVMFLVVGAATPGFVGPGLAETYGWTRSDGLTVGTLVSTVLFLALALGAWWIMLRQTQRNIMRETIQYLTEMDETAPNDAHGGRSDE